MLDNETASRCGHFTLDEQKGWSFKTTCIRSGSSTLRMEAAGSSETRMHKFPKTLKVKDVTSNKFHTVRSQTGHLQETYTYKISQTARLQDISNSTPTEDLQHTYRVSQTARLQDI
jgi:hypothetical protein